MKTHAKTGPGFRNGRHWTQTAKGKRKMRQIAALRSGYRETAALAAPRGHEDLDGLYNALWERMMPAEKKLALRSIVERGFSLIELLVVVAIILIIAAIAIPNLLRAKISANQASAVGSLRTLNTAAISYSSSFGSFPPTILALGPITSGGTANSASADLIDSVLATGTKSGYIFAYTPTGTAPYYGYTITATPVLPAKSGQSQFFTDQSGVIRSDISGTGVSVSSTPIG